MAEERSKQGRDALASDPDRLLDMTLLANQMLSGDPSLNSYQVRNSRALAKAKTLVLLQERRHQTAGLGQALAG